MFLCYTIIMNDKKIVPQTLKGFRDFTPNQARKREYLRARIRDVFERYGFEPIETPALEYLETFTGNIGEDEKLFFKFEDQGGRKVALRYDQTVPTCRYVAQYRNDISFPFKRYQIQSVWRAEKPQKGRYREFLQCDADIFGYEGPEADAEVIALTIDLYQAFGFKDFTVKISDRSIYKDVPYEVILAVDKIKKIGKDAVLTEIEKRGYSKEEAEKLLEGIINAKPTETLNAIFKYLDNLGFSKDLYAFDSSIARSFNYSTGPIWEVVVKGYDAGSVLGGERYDKLVGRFSNQDVPGTGFAIGFDRTFEAMEALNLFPDTLQSTAQVLVTVFSPELLKESGKIASALRQKGIKTDLYTNPATKLDKQLKYADRKQIPYAIIAGPDEIKQKVVKVKNMKSGEQQTIALEQITQALA